MTDDELDLLASAYVDGEATPEEVALVERDPELLARVEEFRAVEVDGPATAPPGLAETQLAAAMAEFASQAAGAPTDAPTEAAEPVAAPVVDLRDRAAGRAQTPPRPRRSLPTWLPAAAAVVVISGGLVWALGQLGTGGDDDTEAATSAFDTTEESADASDGGADESSAAGAADADLAESAAMAEADDFADDAMEEEAMEEESAEDRAADAPAQGESDDESSDDAEAAFAELAPLLFFDEIPSALELDASVLPEPLADVDESACGPEVVAPSLGELAGFVPVEALGQPAELFVYLNPADGTEVRLLVDGDCLPLEP